MLMADLVRWTPRKTPLLTDSGENGGYGVDARELTAAADDGGKAHMAPYESDDSATAADAEELRAARRRKAARYVVPATVVGVAAATIGLVPALADSGDPDLPKISAQELIEKIAASDVQQLSGTVKITTDLGLPDLGGLESSLGSAAGPSGSSRPTARTSRRSRCWRTRPSTASSTTARTSGATTASPTRSSTPRPPRATGSRRKSSRPRPRTSPRRP
jgi:hypothetical protein